MLKAQKHSDANSLLVGRRCSVEHGPEKSLELIGQELVTLDAIAIWPDACYGREYRIERWTTQPGLLLAIFHAKLMTRMVDPNPIGGLGDLAAAQRSIVTSPAESLTHQLVISARETRTWFDMVEDDSGVGHSRGAVLGFALSAGRKPMIPWRMTQHGKGAVAGFVCSWRDMLEQFLASGTAGGDDPRRAGESTGL